MFLNTGPVMAAKRYELSEDQWAKIAPLLPGKIAIRAGADNLLFVNGCLRVLRTGATGVTCPSAMAAGRACISVSADGVAGMWAHLFEVLTVDRDNQYLMIDSTIVRAHQQTARGKWGVRISR